SAADACRNRDVLLSLRQISNRKSLRRSPEPALPEDFSSSRVIGVRMTIPVAAKYQSSGSRQCRRIHRRSGALPPQNLSSSQVHREKLAEVTSRLRMLVVGSRNGSRAALANGFLDVA